MVSGLIIRLYFSSFLTSALRECHVCRLTFYLLGKFPANHSPAEPLMARSRQSLAQGHLALLAPGLL